MPACPDPHLRRICDACDASLIINAISSLTEAQDALHTGWGAAGHLDQDEYDAYHYVWAHAAEHLIDVASASPTTARGRNLARLMWADTERNLGRRLTWWPCPAESTEPSWLRKAG